MERTHHEEERTKMMLVEQELNELRRALQKAEVELESVASKSPKSLQQWLHITYKKESKHFIAKKSKALKQMEEAKDAVSYLCHLTAMLWLGFLGYKISPLSH